MNPATTKSLTNTTNPTVVVTTTSTTMVHAVDTDEVVVVARERLQSANDLLKTKQQDLLDSRQELNRLQREITRRQKEVMLAESKHEEARRFLAHVTAIKKEDGSKKTNSNISSCSTTTSTNSTAAKTTMTMMEKQPISDEDEYLTKLVEVLREKKQFIPPGGNKRRTVQFKLVDEHHNNNSNVVLRDNARGTTVYGQERVVREEEIQAEEDEFEIVPEPRRTHTSILSTRKSTSNKTGQPHHQPVVKKTTGLIMDAVAKQSWKRDRNVLEEGILREVGAPPKKKPSILFW